jgi:16S rRNA (guanine(966)-N(2))-methyltransferase RsmD
MRIISGIHGGRKISPPTNMPYTRPTTDLAKEGLFNILQHQIDFEDIKTLDLFGGTGCITYELGSRGVKESVIVEKDTQMSQFIQKTSTLLQFDHVKVVKMDVFAYISQCKESFDFIFAGPPYALNTIDDLPKEIFKNNLLKEGCMFVLEHTPRNNYKEFDFFAREKNYGTTVFSFFQL